MQPLMAAFFFCFAAFRLPFFCFPAFYGYTWKEHQKNMATVTVITIAIQSVVFIFSKTHRNPAAHSPGAAPYRPALGSSPAVFLPQYPLHLPDMHL
jgi:hypothetical protein